ncbi:hypothetical protein CR162_04390 [Pseudoroseomonas rhizosphaerae]|uniref:Uncharacterized protein n=1 Tax=Teichococcus rhizosphaerae TaxID=1335062 RepID=A0A2C7A7K1_9PROT|nr:hypothetical protein [Pseudoroseomonas rhizosphaerae]PHK96088.1 hypothetical protein CR162_04390 [Pseudoroseomonas rhizosphaerae]
MIQPRTTLASQPHRRLAAAIAELHRSLLNAQAAGSPVASNPYALLQAVMHDPAFLWLRRLSDLILAIDEAGAKGATPSPQAMQGFLSRATAMVLEEGGEEEAETRQRIGGFLLRPDVAAAHARLRELLAELRGQRPH